MRSVLPAGLGILLLCVAALLVRPAIKSQIDAIAQHLGAHSTPAAAAK